MKQKVSGEQQQHQREVQASKLQRISRSSSRCIKALAYKSIKIQQKRYCSNLCQILTPLLCIVFTLVVKIITQQIVSSQVLNLPFPTPMDLPPAKKLVNILGQFQNGQNSTTQNTMNVHINCKQLYLYQYDNPNDKILVDQLIGRMLKMRCDAQGFQISPVFKEQKSVNQVILKAISQGDKQAMQRGQDLMANIPDGVIKIRQIKKNKLNASLAINDLRLPQYHRNNGVTKITLPKKNGDSAMITGFLTITQGAMGLFEKVSRSFLQSIDQKQIIFGNWMYMSFDGQDIALLDKTINILGSSLYPLGLAMLLPLFLYAVVSQKQQRLIQIMKMNGLNVKYYWINFFIFNLIITLVTFSVFYIFGRYIIGLTFFTQTSFAVFSVVLLGWAIAQISLTSFVQVFLSDAKSATIVGYLLSTFSTLTGQPLVTVVYAFPTPIPTSLLLFPPFTLCRAINMIAYACSNQACYSSFDKIDYQLVRCIVILYLWFFMFLLSIWLNDIIQQDYGVAHKPWIIQYLHKKLCYNFLCQICFNKKKELNKFDNQIQMISQTTGEEMKSANNDIKEFSANSQASIKSIKIDNSVKIQAQKVSSLPIDRFPLISKSISKKYSTFSSTDQQYVALKPLTLSLKSKQIFGLLGPNGAGKTTFISVLTGMYPQTEGNAWIKGYSIGYTQTNRLIGVCPQFDLLWPDLTVYEHLKFYALLKGVDQSSIQREIDQFMNDFDLNDWRKTSSKQLSGGMKRRLSIANSLIGNPQVVFLDEPSSGLDPAHRRQLWQILLQCKRKTCILLTTHLMQQAEVLCDRIGIIDKGNLLCLGQQHQLKQKFGKGYRLTINFNNLNHQKMMKERQNENENKSKIMQQQQERQINSIKNKPLIKQIIQNFNGVIINQLKSRVIFKIQKKSLIKCVSLLKKENDITWLISQPSLYDVFVDFVQ